MKTSLTVLKDQQKNISLPFFKMGCGYSLLSRGLALPLKWGFFFNISDQKSEYTARDQWLTFFSQTA